MERIGLILHAGCGREPLPAWLSAYKEVRLDIDPDVGPDIVAPLTSLGEIGPFDAVWCSHVLEHLPQDQIEKALQEFKRVTKEGAPVMVIVPDTENIEPTDDVLYQSPIGPITGKDLHFGCQSLIQSNEYMRHQTQFVRDSLNEIFSKVFSRSEVRRLSGYNIFAVGVH